MKINENRITIKTQLKCVLGLAGTYPCRQKLEQDFNAALVQGNLKPTAPTVEPKSSL